MGKHRDKQISRLQSRQQLWDGAPASVKLATKRPGSMNKKRGTAVRKK